MKEADEEEFLLLRSVFNGFKGAEEEQRESIFHFSCMVQGRACSLIIDDGSSANVVSLSIMAQLRYRHAC